MKMEELKVLFKEQGWTLHMHNRRNRGKKYVYAAWRDGERVRQRYVAPLARMELMSREQVQAKLQTLSKNG